MSVTENAGATHQHAKVEGNPYYIYLMWKGWHWWLRTYVTSNASYTWLIGLNYHCDINQTNYNTQSCIAPIIRLG